MLPSLTPAKDYNRNQSNPSMRFRTESGKDRETGYVVSWHDADNTHKWFPNRGQAKRAAKSEPPISTPSAANGERYDQNS